LKGGVDEGRGVEWRAERRGRGRGGEGRRRGRSSSGS
jgi:hypothetical protein